MLPLEEPLHFQYHAKQLSHLKFLKQVFSDKYILIKSVISNSPLFDGLSVFANFEASSQKNINRVQLDCF